MKTPARPLLERLTYGLLVAFLVFLPYSTLVMADIEYQFDRHGHALPSLAIKALTGWKEGLLVALLLLLALRLLSERRWPWHWARADLWIISFMAVGTAVGYLLTHSLGKTVFGFRYDFEVFLYYFVARSCLAERAQIEGLLRWMLLLGLPILLFGVAQTLILPAPILEGFGYSFSTSVTGNPLPPYHIIGAHTVRAMGTFPGPNSLAMYCVELFLIAAVFARRWWGRGWMLATAGLALLCLLLTFSRAHVIALLTAGALYGLTSWVERRFRWGSARLAWAASGALLVALIAFLGATIVVGQGLGSGGLAVLTHGSSTQGHSDVATQALQLFRERPWGSGLGTAGLATTNTHGTVFNPEVWYLQLLVEFGWWGLLAALAVAARLMRQLFTMREDLGEPGDRLLWAYLFLQFVAILVGADFLPAWFEVASLGWWVVFGLAVSAYLRDFPKSREGLSVQARA